METHTVIRPPANIRNPFVLASDGLLSLRLIVCDSVFKVGGNTPNESRPPAKAVTVNKANINVMMYFMILSIKQIYDLF